MVRNKRPVILGIGLGGLILLGMWILCRQPPSPMRLDVTTQTRDKTRTRVTVEVMIRVSTPSREVTDYGVVFDPPMKDALVIVPGCPPLRRGVSRRISAFIQCPRDQVPHIFKVRLVRPDGRVIFAESPTVSVGTEMQ